MRTTGRGSGLRLGPPPFYMLAEAWGWGLRPKASATSFLHEIGGLGRSLGATQASDTVSEYFSDYFGPVSGSHDLPGLNIGADVVICRLSVFRLFPSIVAASLLASWTTSQDASLGQTSSRTAEHNYVQQMYASSCSD